MKKGKINSAKNIVNQAPKKALKITKKDAIIAAPKVEESENEGQKMRVTFSQNAITKKGDELKKSITYETTATQDVAKQSLGHFYAVVDKYKRANQKLFNFAYPIYLKVEKDGETIDLEGLRNTEYLGLTNGLKLQWNNDGLRRFGRNVRIAIEAVQESKFGIITDEYQVFNK